MISYIWSIAGLLALAVALPAKGQTGRPMALADMFRIQRISTPALSPDGKWVAYTRTLPDLTANKNRSDLWVSSIDGRITRHLTTTTANDRNPAWSPNGRRIAFESTRSGESQIWLVNSDGGEPIQFTKLSTGGSQPVWSSDGTMIAFISEVFPEYSRKPFPECDSLNRGRLEERSNARVKAELFTHLLYRHWDHWVEGKRQHLFVQSVAGGEPRDLTPGDRDAVPTSSTFSGGLDFAFSPDGKEIAYTATPVPAREEAWSTNHDIFTVAVTGGTPRQLTTNPAADGAPRYSPDGKYLAYRAQSRPGFEADRWQLMLLDRMTGSLRSLTARFDASVESPVWSPESKRLFFEAEIDAHVPIFAVSIAGDDVQPIVEEHSNHDIAVTKDGRTLVFTQSSVVRPSEIYRWSTVERTVSAITHANDELFDSLTIPPPENVQYEGVGGTRIQSWLFSPPGFNSKRKYPFVLFVHGGPQSAWTDSWSYRWNPALWAAQGYVLMAPNPHGSTGFGQAFTDAISKDWGGKVFLDLMKALDYADSLSFVDKERRAAAGASFGAYMINWFLGNAGNRFKAFVSHCGIYNLESAYGSTEELWFDEWERGGTPWDQPEAYRKHAPNTVAQNFSTPTLVIHGAYDFRIPFTESMQLFTALQRRGVPSKFLYFPDEGHWVLKPANSEFWHTTVFDWLQEYLSPSL